LANRRLARCQSYTSHHLSLTPGARLGVYEITAAIGEGGMGQVYRARDTKLDRDVAIKILPEAFAHDADRLARFTREAKTLASLNHPHIAAIYGLEESDGITALVMELVEGDDLSQRIARGAIPIDEALPIAKQIAEALEAAHEQGIIHRDLKPANIKVRADGTVKVLDFGLAKAMDPPAGSSPSVSISPTITTPAMTQAGMILGTAAYMAPEQARGKAVDKRADIWAFGAVIYEMLTGQRAFEGEDIADTLGNVMKLEPNWQRVPASIPPRVVQVMQVCLQKDPRQRLDSAQGVRLALDGAFETAASAPTQTSAPSPGGRLAWMAALVFAAVVIAAMTVPTLRYLRETPPPETRTDIVTPATDQPASFALSPDGRQIVFVASGDGASGLWLRSLATTTAQPLAGTEGATLPFWSPDGRSVGFFAGGALKRLDLGGGAPQTLAPVTFGSGGTWNAEGVIVFAPDNTGPLLRVSATGGQVTAVTTLGPQQLGHRLPFFLPDGHRILFTSAGAPEALGIYLAALDGSSPTRLAPDYSQAAYLPAGLGDGAAGGGWLFWARANTLVAQRLDLDRPTLVGDPVTLADGMRTVIAGTTPAGWSVAASGLIAYRTGGARQRQLMWAETSGMSRGTVGEPDGTLRMPRVSPDGRRVVVDRVVQGNQDLWLLDGARMSRLTFDPAFDSFPVWSPDGTRIAFTSARSGAGALYQTRTNGAGGAERLVAGDRFMYPSSWSRDERFLLYTSIDPQTGGDLWVVPMAGERTPSAFLKTPFVDGSGAFSPDGRWVAYQSNESGRNEVYVRPFVPPGAASTPAAEAGGQWQVSAAGGIHPVWRPDGKALYYLNPAGAMMAAPVTVVGNVLEPGAPVVLFPTRIVGGGVEEGTGRQYDVAPDGRFLINTELPGDATPITLIQHWNPEAKK
jgi:Tol biopolymer transport system component